MFYGDSCQQKGGKTHEPCVTFPRKRCCLTRTLVTNALDKRVTPSRTKDGKNTT